MTNKSTYQADSIKVSFVSKQAESNCLFNQGSEWPRSWQPWSRQAHKHTINWKIELDHDQLWRENCWLWNYGVHLNNPKSPKPACCRILFRHKETRLCSRSYDSVNGSKDLLPTALVRCSFGRTAYEKIKDDKSQIWTSIKSSIGWSCFW